MLRWMRPPLRSRVVVFLAILLIAMAAPLGARAGNNHYGRHNGNNHYGRHTGNDGYWGPGWHGPTFVRPGWGPGWGWGPRFVGGPVWWGRPVVAPPVFFGPAPVVVAPPVAVVPAPFWGPSFNFQIGFGFH